MSVDTIMSSAEEKAAQLFAALQQEVWYPLLRKLMEQHGATVYLVGGAVRDYIYSGQLSEDLDFIVAGMSVEQLAVMLAQELQGRCVTLDADFGIFRVIYWPEKHTQGPTESAAGSKTVSLDFARLQGTAGKTVEHIQEDLLRRDITINAMAVSLLNGQLLDPSGGYTDIQANCLRMVAVGNFQDDPLRLLRVFRFQARYADFSIDPETRDCIKRYAFRLLEPAGERLQQEWLKMLSYPRVAHVVQGMLDVGLLEVLLPELIPCRKVPPNSHHHLPLLEHTLELIHQLDTVWPTLPEQVQRHLLQPVGQNSNRLALVRFACLLHDIGKPDTWTIDEIDGRHRFLGHEAYGETLCDPITRRLRMSDAAASLVKRLVRWHLYPCQFGAHSSLKSVLRFYRRMGDATLDVTVLALVDRLSTNGPAITEAVMQQDVANHYWLMRHYLEQQAQLKAPPLLDGKKVMALLQLKPGPQVGKILAAVQEAQHLGDISNEADAAAWLLKHFN